MELPIRLSSAKTLLDQYLNVVEPYLATGDDGFNEITRQLEQLKNKCEILSTQMLQSLGYKGDLSNMERELQQNIKELQNTTFYLNGNDLLDFIYLEVANATASNPKFQKYYNDFLYDVCSKEGIQVLEENLPQIANAVNRALNESFSEGTFVVSNGVARGRDIRGRFALNVSLDFYKTSGEMQKRILEKIQSQEGSEALNIKSTIKQVKEGADLDFFAELNDTNLANYLRHSKNDIKAIEKIAPGVIDKVNILVKNRIIQNYKGNNQNILEESIDYVLSEKPTAFFVGNNIKDLTGILGEIQGLYYIRCILKKHDVNDSEVKWIGGINNPHADLILENILGSFGIQIKNTTKSDALLEVKFENFKSDLVSHMKDGNVQFDWLKESANKYSDTLTQDPVLFNAASNLIGMETFNIPYKWVGTGKRGGNYAKEVPVEEVEEFAPTRQKIIDAAFKARQALVKFFVGMMYIQLSPTAQAGSSSTLYLIGGTLAITSATLLNEIIQDLTGELDRIKFYFTSQLTEKAKQKNADISRIGNIVEFLNAGYGNHLNGTKYILESSYTFKL